MSTEKPPIGLRPEVQYRRDRVGEIIDAMYQYRITDKDIPSYWARELLEHTEYIENQGFDGDY